MIKKGLATLDNFIWAIAGIDFVVIDVAVALIGNPIYSRNSLVCLRLRNKIDDLLGGMRISSFPLLALSLAFRSFSACFSAALRSFSTCFSAAFHSFSACFSAAFRSFSACFSTA